MGLLCLTVYLASACIARAAEPVDFLRDVKPILAAHCCECHGDKKQESGLRLDNGRDLAAGGASGPAFVAGESGESLLIQAVSGAEDVAKMPPRGPGLDAAAIDLLKRWVDEGAKVPQEAPPPSAPRHADHWSFQPVAPAAPPPVNNRAWVRNPIDAFVLARLEAASLAPSAEADKTTLIRRLSFDLVGLPPSVEQVDAFLADTGQDAYERLVDSLLSSPHYGERWGRHWLDVARYADSNGYTIDSGRSIWKYRDWVINALNRDLPFDRFTIEQLAGDMLEGASLDQIIATGFHRNTLVNEEGGTDPEQFRVEAVVDRVSTTGAAFLGLTLGCARCHDHKYDPVSQREFYQLFAIFNNADEPVLPVPTDQQAKELPALLAEIAQVKNRLGEVDSNAGGRQGEWETKLAARLQAAAAATGEKPAPEVEPPVVAALAVAREQRNAEQQETLRVAFQKVDPERTPLIKQLNDLEESKKQISKSITTTLIVRQRKEPRATHIHVRGDFLHQGAPVEANVPAVLPPIAARSGTPDRLDFARWLVDARNPLTPRVTVNRIWQAYFGQGLVTTENDFGLQGERPIHPELLDWLARALVEERWSLKALHRLIVTSATYRQSSRTRADLAAADPYNKLLGRQQRLRLEAETIRDAALTVSGMLSDEIGGPGVYPPQPQGIYRFTQQVKFWGESKTADRYRRGLYTYFWRSSPYPFLKTFDAPDANVACTRRPRSNTPLQALTLANDPAFYEIAQGFAARILASPASDETQRLRGAFRCSLARDPAAEELSGLLEYLHQQRDRFATAPQDAATVAGLATPAAAADTAANNTAAISATATSTVASSAAATSSPTDVAAWTMVARVLLNVDEFITRE